MIHAAEPIQTRRDFRRLSGLPVAVVLSLLLHGAVIWHLPTRLKSPTPQFVGDPSLPLTVLLEPPSSPAFPRVPLVRPATPPLPQVQPTPAAKRPPQTAKLPIAPPPVTLRQPAPTPQIILPEPAVTEPAPTEVDLAAYIEAQRRARGTPTPAPPSEVSQALPAEDENSRASRIATANLRLREEPRGYDKSSAGGVFQVTRKSYDYAEFTFFGWHREVRRNISQQIEVRKGDSATIELAIVRRMISIIRQYEQEDFTWHSRRLGRSLKLSARVRDSTGLEEFMLREFF
jgi:hypothetical protein